MAAWPEDSLFRAPLLSQGLQARSQTSARNLNHTATDVFLVVLDGLLFSSPSNRLDSAQIIHALDACALPSGCVAVRGNLRDLQRGDEQSH